jgi:hypothetical protein
MRLVDSVAIAAAEALERTAGPRAALAAWRRLAMQGLGPEGRAAAAAHALRCAVAVGDTTTIETLTVLWSDMPAGRHFSSILAVCRALARGGKLRLASRLAAAEAEREPTALAKYLYARTLELEGDARCAEIAADAARRADEEGARTLAARARLRRAAWLARSHATLTRALEAAGEISTEHLGDRDRLVLADVLLRSPSRFARATAVDMLDRIGAGSDRELAARARGRALRLADDGWTRLTRLEADRLIALAKRAPDAEAVLARLRAVIDGPPERGHRAPAAPLDDAGAAIAKLVLALREGRHADAVDALREASRRVEREGRASCASWSAAELALGSDEDIVRREAAAFARRLLDTTSIPPRGFLTVSAALDAAGFGEPAELAARAAVAQREPGAAAALGALLRRRGWAGAASHPASALAALREAKALLSPSGPSGASA